MSSKQSPPQNHGILFFTLLEIGLIFAVFAVFAAWPIPDSNEAHYITKAIHFWQPTWVEGNAFLDSSATHWFFYATFGWLSLLPAPLTPSPYGMAVVGRLVSWTLLAWSWRRLSFALIPQRGVAILTALAFAYYLETFHMAGEWVFGGVEAKTFAFPFIFFGLTAMIRGRWHWVWIFFGLAAAFHVLVGGWAVCVAVGVWLVTDARRVFSSMRCSVISEIPPFRLLFQKFSIHKLPWGLFIGGLLSLPGLLPALLFDRGTPTEIVQQAHQIYVFDRIIHHLVPYLIPWTFVCRFLLLATLWAVICRFGRHAEPRFRRFDGFVWGTLVLAAIGFAAAYGLKDNQTLSAEILRFYWFRMADVAVPMGVALGGTWKLWQLWSAFCNKTSGVLQIQSAAHHFKNTALPKGEGILLINGVSLGILFGLSFVIYIFLDWAFFCDRIDFGRIQAEPGIPWMITLIVVWLAARYRKILPATKTLVSILILITLLVYAPFDRFKDFADQRTAFAFSRIEMGRGPAVRDWLDVCQWISQNTPKNAQFWVSRDAATFKWHARRSDVGVWKDVPQDAASIVDWYERMHDLFFYRDEFGNWQRDRSFTVHLSFKTPEEIETLRNKYGFEYVVVNTLPELPQFTNWEIVYENALYRVLRASNL